MDPFRDIRPYNDDEVGPVLIRLLANAELIDAIARLRFPRLPKALLRISRPAVKWLVARQLQGVNSVHDFQSVVAKYMARMIEATTTRLTASGLENLEKNRPYLFISNHRDIAMDPAFVNYTLFTHGMGTLRIAIGDNLLTRDYVADLMRLNKSFIVNRSAKGRQMLMAARQLAAYIRHSIIEEQGMVWIAQREGRAKDGMDRTEPAVLKMFTMAQDKTNESFSEFIGKLRIVPVAISYELDPCDVLKARELMLLDRDGEYRKGEREDIQSIATGITGQKGHVHVSFGRPLTGEFADVDQVAAVLDQQIIGQYRLMPSNYFAYHELHGKFPQSLDICNTDHFNPDSVAVEKAVFYQRLAAVPADLRNYWLYMYANPVHNKQSQQVA